MMRFRIILLITIISYSLTNAQVVFGPKKTIKDNPNHAGSIFAIEAIDVDLDGDLDVLTLGSQDRTVAWFENLGNGVFGDKNFIDTIRPTNQIGLVEVVDLDKDGDWDILGAATRDLFLYENVGNGEFVKNLLVDNNTSLEIEQIKAEDIDGDSNIDIVIGTSDIDQIGWYRNDGAGNFDTLNVVTTAIVKLQNIVVHDLDSDGDQDIISTSSDDDKIAWYQNDGSGNFSSQIIIDTNFMDPFGIALDDIDGDGDDDVITTHHRQSQLGWYENLGNGEIDSTPNILEKLTVSSNTLVCTNDIDLDGDIDVIVERVNRFSLNTIEIFFNSGNGDFTTTQMVDTFYRVKDFLLNDFNGNGYSDIVSLEVNSDKILLHLNDINTSFQNKHIISFKHGPRSIRTADINGNGQLDILTSFAYDTKLAWFENDFSNQFNHENDVLTFDPHAADYDPIIFEIADFNGNGRNDIVTASLIDDKLTWQANLGNGTFGERIYIDSVLNREDIAGIHVVDIDTDGDQDLFVSRIRADFIFWYKNDGAGNFSKQEIESTYSFSQVITTADADNDGDLDVFMVQPSDRRTSIYLNDGNEVFGAPMVIDSTLRTIRGIDFGDLDKDGDLDLFVSVAGDDLIAWFENDGLGNFILKDTISEDIKNVQKILLIDIDNDDDLDIVASDKESSSLFFAISLMVFVNQGDFNFQRIEVGDLRRGSYDFSVGDLDDDGDLDIVATSGLNEEVIWMENLTDEELTTITGKLFWDVNEDSIFNGDDIPFSGHPLKLMPEEVVFYADSEGNYSVITADTGNHMIQITPPDLYQECRGLVSFDQSPPQNLPYTFTYVALSEIQQDFAFIANDDLNQRCYEVSGVVFIDANQNGVQDNNENGAAGILVQADNNQSTFTSSNGSYAMTLPNDEATILDIDLEYNRSNGYCSNFSTYTQTYPANNYNIPANSQDLDTLDFGVFGLPQNNYDVGLYTLNVFAGDKPGKAFHAWMDFKSSGAILQTCTLRIEHDPLLTLIQADIPVTNQGDDFIEWIFPPGTAPSFWCMQMDWFLDAAAVEGDTLHWEATYLCPPGEDDCSKNNKLIRNIIVNSGPLRLVDGDAKLYSLRPEGIMPEVIQNETVLSYVVTFKNPLETTAYNVTIIDTLPEALDLTSLAWPFSSFPDYHFSISPEGVLVWQLNGINLSSVSDDELNSYGFVQFNVKLKNGLQEGTIIPNKITVQFNGIELLETNEVIHRLDNAVSVKDNLASSFEVQISPNPFSNQTNFSIQRNQPFKYDLKLFDVLGKEMSSYTNLSKQDVAIKRENLPSGLYILNLYQNGKEEVVESYKLIVE